MALDPSAHAAPLLPARASLTALGHACDATDRTTVPDVVRFEANLADVTIPGLANPTSGSAGTIGFVDTVSAVYRRAAPTSGGSGTVAIAANSSPDNQSSLQALLEQLLVDYCTWSLVRFDRVYIGALAIPPDPLIDLLELGYDGESGAWTRIRSAPTGSRPTQFNHQDPGDCPECLSVYGPPVPAHQAIPVPDPDNTTEPSAQLQRWRWCLERGRSVLKPDGVDNVQACCDCETIIIVNFLPMPCGDPSAAPTAATYSIDGTTTQGQTIHLGGPFPNNLALNGNQLPEGTYTLQVQSQPTPCGAAYGDAESRWAGSTQFTVKCPLTRVVLNLTAKFDLISTGSSFRLSACARNGPHLDQIPIQVGVSVGGDAVICTQTTPSHPGTNGNGNVGVTLKVRSYPVSLTFTGNAPDFLPAVETVRYLGCTATAYDRGGSDYKVNPPVLMYKYYDIHVTTFGGQFGVANATVTVSGGLSGSGTTAGSGFAQGGTGVMTLGSFVPNKNGPNDPDQSLLWTIQAPTCLQRRYRYNAPTGTIEVDTGNGTWQPNSSVDGGGTVCPMGGEVDCPGGPGGGAQANTTSPSAAAASSPASAGFNLPQSLTGCVVTPPERLHATIFGQAVPLDFDSTRGEWTGFFSAPLPAHPCPHGDPAPTHPSGPVQCCLALAGLQPGGGGRFVLWYTGDPQRAGEPSRCPNGAANPPRDLAAAPGSWSAVPGFGSVPTPTGSGAAPAASNLATESPFLVLADVAWTYALTTSAADGSSTRTLHTVPVALTITA